MNRIFATPSQTPGTGKGSTQMNTHNPNDFRYRVRRSDEAPVTRFDRVPLAVRTLSSNTLFQGEHEIGIEHHGALYRLKITRQGKLILNK
jgi:hemin uptake protein HemP